MPTSDLNVLAVDTAINAEGHAPGIAQPVSLDEIKDIYMSNAPRETRLSRLQQIRQEIVARDSADREGGFDGLIQEIDRGIDYMKRQSDGNATPATLDMVDRAVNPDNFSDS